MRKEGPHHATEPLQPKEPELSKATVKVLLLDESDPKDPKFPFVIEKPSIFYRRAKNGKIEPCEKRKGKGFPGGKVNDDEMPFADLLHAKGVNVDELLNRVDTNLKDELLGAIREGEEELGIPAKIIAERLTGVTWIRYSGWEGYPWILFYGDGQGLQLDRQAIQDPKLIKLMGWNKAAWAHLCDLRKTILPPRDEEERERRKEAGDVWFYTGHMVGMLAMLLKLKKEQLFATVLRQTPLRYVFTRPMMEMLTSFGVEDRYLRILNSPRFAPDQKLAERIAKQLIGLQQEDQHLSALLERAERGWRKGLEEFVATQLKQRKLFGRLYLRAAEEEGQMQGLEQMDDTGPTGADVEEEPTPVHPALRRLAEAARRQY